MKICAKCPYVAHVTGPCELGTVHHSCPCGIIQYVILLGYPIRPLGRARALGHGAVLVMHMHSENTVSRPHMPLALGMEIFTRDHDQRACDSGPRHTGLLVVHLRSLTAAPVAPGRPIYVFLARPDLRLGCECHKSAFLGHGHPTGPCEVAASPPGAVVSFSNTNSE